MGDQNSAVAKTDFRVRRAKDNSEFLAKLTQEGPFQTMRDAMGFAAALGFTLGKREPFEGTDEPIAWSTFVNKPNQEQLVEMIAAAVVGDPEILGDDSLSERILILEEYANAGLSALKQMPTNLPLVEALTNLILDQQLQGRGEDLDKLIDELAQL